mgnify:CR=1 FL=1
MSLIKLERQLLVYCFLISWILLLFLEVGAMVMLEEQEIELLISYLLKWTVLEQRKIFSLLVLQIDHKF